MRRLGLRNVIPLLAVLSICPSSQAGSWTTESARQAYVLNGCGADSGTSILTLNMGDRVYRIGSASPIYKAALNIGTKAVIHGNSVQIYALSGFPTVTHRIRSSETGCSDADGIDILGISIDGKASSGVARGESSRSGIRLSRSGAALVVAGAKQPCELLDLDGRLIGRSRPDSDGGQSFSVSGLRKGAYLLRSGTNTIRFVNF